MKRIIFAVLALMLAVCLGVEGAALTVTPDDAIVPDVVEEPSEEMPEEGQQTEEPDENQQQMEKVEEDEPGEEGPAEEEASDAQSPLEEPVEEDPSVEVPESVPEDSVSGASEPEKEITAQGAVSSPCANITGGATKAKAVALPSLEREYVVAVKGGDTIAESGGYIVQGERVWFKFTTPAYSQRSLPYRLHTKNLSAKDGAYIEITEAGEDSWGIYNKRLQQQKEYDEKLMFVRAETTYYISLSSCMPGEVRFQLEWVTPPAGEVPETAHAILLGKMVQGTIPQKKDGVWYAFQAPASEGYRLEILRTDTEQDLEILVRGDLNSGGQMDKRFWHSEARGTVCFYQKKGNMCYVQVKGTAGATFRMAAYKYARSPLGMEVQHVVGAHQGQWRDYAAVALTESLDFNSRYVVFRSTKKTGTYKKVGVMKTGNVLYINEKYVDKTVKKGKTYYYRIQKKLSVTDLTSKAPKTKTVYSGPQSAQKVQMKRKLEWPSYAENNYLTMAVGESKDMHASAKVDFIGILDAFGFYLNDFENGPPFRYSSSNPAVASVAKGGTVTAHRKGSTTLTVKRKNHKKLTCKITVGRPVKKLKISHEKLTLQPGKTKKLKTTVSPKNASDKKVIFKSSNPMIVSVDSKGQLKAKQMGTARITVSTRDQNRTKVCQVTVGYPVTKVELNHKELTVKKGKTKKLKVTMTPTYAADKELKWTSSNKKVATVDENGRVKGLKKGKTTITAKATDGSKKSSKCRVTVGTPVKSVKLSKTALSLKKGEKTKLKATVRNKKASNKKLRWKSSNKRVAVVNSKGEVTAKVPGKAVVTAIARDGSGKKAKCTVTVH